MINMHPEYSIFAKSLWIWTSDRTMNSIDDRIQARKTFYLEYIPENCPICLSADAAYILYVNGQYVTRGPARGFHGNWPYDRVDISPFLHKGRNVIAILGYQYGISTFSYIYGNEAGIILAGTIDDVVLNTNCSWKIRHAPGYKKNIARLSLQLGFQELYDAETDPLEKWKDIEYDDTEWNNSVLTTRPPGAMPWHSFEERGIPLLTNTIISPEKIIGESAWLSDPNYSTPQNLVSLYLAEKHEWIEYNGKGKADLLHFAAWEKNETHALLLDFSKEVVGNLIIEIDTSDNTAIIDLLATESISTITPDLGNPETLYCKMAFGNRIRPNKGITRHDFFSIWGFRYLVVIVRGNASALSAKITLRQTLYPLNINGKFETSNQRMNSIWKMCCQTQQNCMIDAYVDCPWREQAQWWGDAFVHAKNTFMLSPDARLLNRGIRQIGTQKTFSGLTYAHAPTSSHQCIIPDFSLVWLMSHWLYYWQTSDDSLFIGMKSRIIEVLEYFRLNTGDKGLLIYDERYWLFLDWCNELHKDGISTVLNLQYLLTLQQLQQLASVTKQKDMEKECHIRSERIIKSIKKYLYDRFDGWIWDGIDQDGNVVKQQSPHVAAMAILTNIFPECHQHLIDKILLPLVRAEKPRNILMPSTFFMYYIFEALKQYGYNRDIIDCILRWWGEWIDDGLSTLPENWHWQQFRGESSLCHAWSAHPIVHFTEIIIGIKQTSPGWDSITFSPLMSKGGRANGIIPTPYGNIAAGWDYTGNEPKQYINKPERIIIKNRVI